MNESNQTIESLLAQLPEERLPNEWLFSIQMGILLVTVCLIILCIVGFFALKKRNKVKANRAIIDNWNSIFNNVKLDDRIKIEQANHAIKLNLNPQSFKDDEFILNTQTLNGTQWSDFIHNNFTNIQKNTIELLAHSHYQEKCKIANPNQFNLDVQSILKECLK